MPVGVPPRCPSCGGELVVVKLACPSCGSEITGEYELCPVCRLDAENRRVFDLFLKARGNLKDVQREMKVSYPTVRARVEVLFQQLGQAPEPPDPLRVLSRLRAGEIDAETAEKLLKGEM